jgi:deoxyribonuclease-4
MFGSHLSIAGSMVHALTDAVALGLDTVQVFTKNQQQWAAKPLDPGMVTDWHAKVKEIGFDRGGPTDAKGRRRGGITSHASYLINLAAPDDTLWNKSIDLMVDEIERCETLGIPFLVHHPGAYTTSDLATGLARIAAAYKTIFQRTKGYATVSCLEGTVGAGSQIGGPFEELATLRTQIIATTGEPARIGFCLDTCHMHAAGYDMATRAAGDKALAEFDRLCGLSNLKAFHVNDSKGAVASHLDRHMHIGEGTIGGSGPGRPPGDLARVLDSGFASVVNHPALADVPKHLETPKDDPVGGVAWDTLNVARLRALKPGQSALWPTSPPPNLQPKPASKPDARKPAPKGQQSTLKSDRPKPRAKATKQTQARTAARPALKTNSKRRPETR